MLEHLGVDVPDEMNGSEITSADERDPAARSRPPGRASTIVPAATQSVLLPLGDLAAADGLAALAWRAAGRALALRLLALSLRLGAAAPAAARRARRRPARRRRSRSGSGRRRWRWRPIGCSRRLRAGSRSPARVTVGAYAVDVVAGSPLTALSVLGPNPGAGVRFFGIGNELEAILTTLTLIGTGAWLQSRRELEPRRCRRLVRRRRPSLAAAAFAPGRFGADVGAAIVLGVGAATAAVLALGLERRRAIAVVAGGGVARRCWRCSPSTSSSAALT